jgi:hypothetical protein
MRLSRFLAAVSVVALALSPAFGAGTPNSFVTPQTPNRGIAQFTSSSSAGTYVTLYTAGTNGSRCYGLWATSNDATSHLVTVQLVNSATKYGGVAIATGTTTPGFASGAPSLNLMAAANWPGLPVDQYGNPYLQMISGDTLQATFATAITATDVVNLVASCSDF